MQIVKDVRFGTDYVDSNNVLHVGGTGVLIVSNANQVAMASDYYGPGTLAHTEGWKVVWERNIGTGWTNVKGGSDINA